MRAYCTPGSVRGAPGNRCPYLDITCMSEAGALKCRNVGGDFILVDFACMFSAGGSKIGTWKGSVCLPGTSAQSRPGAGLGGMEKDM